jgi:hypothetical protein
MQHISVSPTPSRTRKLALPLALSASMALAGVVGTIGALTPTPAHAAVPTITSFVCPIDNGGGRFYCFIDYSSDSAATVTWSGSGTILNEPGHSDFYGRCSIGSSIRVTVTVTNASGATSRSTGYFTCRGGPIIL